MEEFYFKIAQEVMALAKEIGWSVLQFKKAQTTYSCYIELCRNNEYVTIRVSDHSSCREKYIPTLSLAPGDLCFEEIEQILRKSYGEVGIIIT